MRLPGYHSFAHPRERGKAAVARQHHVTKAMGGVSNRCHPTTSESPQFGRIEAQRRRQRRRRAACRDGSRRSCPPGLWPHPRRLERFRPAAPARPGWSCRPSMPSSYRIKPGCARPCVARMNGWKRCWPTSGPLGRRRPGGGMPSALAGRKPRSPGQSVMR